MDGKHFAQASGTSSTCTGVPGQYVYRGVNSTVKKQQCPSKSKVLYLHYRSSWYRHVEANPFLNFNLFMLGSFHLLFSAAQRQLCLLENSQ